MATLFSLRRAINAVRQWRFSETLLAGQSVETEETLISSSDFQSGGTQELADLFLDLPRFIWRAYK